MDFQFKYVSGHVEVYDGCGNFCFSADSASEAMRELRDFE